MIDQFLIINDAGLPLFDWRPSEKGSDSNLVSGFLSALNMFASGERGEQIKKITMDPTSFIFEREGNLVFVILTQDPQFEAVINLILTNLKEAFLTEFGEHAAKFAGNVTVFLPFEAILVEILKEFGYFDYIQAMVSFSRDESLRGTIFVDKISGKVLYLKWKEYIDREKISFQSVLLLRTFERMIVGTFNESPLFLNIISESMRSIILKSTMKVALIAEIHHKEAYGFPTIEITEKKVQNFLKKLSARANFELEESFFLFDENGKILAKNDKENRLKADKSTIDCITLVKSASDVIIYVFKEKLFTLLLGTPDNLYFLCPIGNLYSLLLVPADNVPEMKSIYTKLQNLIALNENEMKQFGKALLKVQKFKTHFA